MAAGALWDRLDRHRVPARLLTAAGLLAFAASLIPLRSETLAEQSLAALTYLLAVKLLTRKGRRDHLQVLAVSLMLVVAIFAVANTAQHESGLLAVTVMGIVLANQRVADLRHIVEFKENGVMIGASDPRRDGIALGE